MIPPSYVIASPFWQFVDHWQTLIAGGFALIAGAVAYIAGVQQAHATTRASRNQLAAAARKDRLQARSIALAIYPELELLRVLRERTGNIITNNIPAVKGTNTAAITEVMTDARIRIPPFLYRNIDNIFIIEPAGGTILQLISFIMRLNDMLETLAHNIATGVVDFDPPTHQQDLVGVLQLISTSLQMAITEIAPIHDEATRNS